MRETMLNLHRNRIEAEALEVRVVTAAQSAGWSYYKIGKYLGLPPATIKRRYPLSTPRGESARLQEPRENPNR